MKLNSQLILLHSMLNDEIYKKKLFLKMTQNFSKVNIWFNSLNIISRLRGRNNLIKIKLK